MLLSESWMRKVQDYEHRIQVIKLRIEAKRLEHNLNALIREHEEEKRAAQEQYFELSKSTFQVLNTSKGEVLDSSPIFDSYEEHSELPMNLFPEDHGVEVDEKRAFDPYPTHDLFHDAPIDHEICELNDPPIYDSYELEDDDLSSMSTLANGKCTKADLKPFCAIFGQQGADSLEFEFNLVWDELNEAIPPICNELKCFSSETDLIGQHVEDSPSILGGEDSLLIEGTKSGVERGNSGLIAPKLNLISPIAAPNGLNHTYSLLSLAIHNQPMLQESFVARMSNILSVTSPEQSRENSFKDCYVFKKKGAHSEQTFIEGTDFKPGVHIELAVADIAIDNTQGLMLAPCIAQTESAQIAPNATIFKVPWTYEEGLLDYYIEDDELKDDRRLLFLQSASQGSRLQDLRSNLHQPGVFDAGASKHHSHKFELYSL